MAGGCKEARRAKGCRDCRRRFNELYRSRPAGFRGRRSKGENFGYLSQDTLTEHSKISRGLAGSSARIRICRRNQLEQGKKLKLPLEIERLARITWFWPDRITSTIEEFLFVAEGQWYQFSLVGSQRVREIQRDIEKLLSPDNGVRTTAVLASLARQLEAKRELGAEETAHATTGHSGQRQKEDELER